MIPASAIKVLTPFWPTKNIDPIKLRTVGDWSMLQDLYANLVELSSSNSVRPALAESFTQSADSLTWVFTLRKNLKWSDGSVMTAGEITSSLMRSAHGTVHTNASSYVENIIAESETQVKFTLKSLPENFLTSLAFVDFAIVHPLAFEGEFTWAIKSSGAYRVKTYSDNVIEIVENDFYWENVIERPKNITLIRAKGDMRDYDSLINKEFEAAQLPPGLLTRDDQLMALEKNYSIFYGNVDFNFMFIFSKNNIRKLQFPIEVRQHLFCKTQNAFWATHKNHKQRATGLRPPGTIGSLDLQEYQIILTEICSAKKPANLPSKIEVLVADTEVNRPLIKVMLTALEASGVPVALRVVSKMNFNAEFEVGEFDLALVLYGADEDDPDSCWRIYRSDFCEELVSKEELNLAQAEKNTSLRNELYKNIEMKALRRALFIPLKNEYTYILTDGSLVLDKTQAADWGLQLYKLRIK
jgi:ABC-type transport system substrate-binding protein